MSEGIVMLELSKVRPSRLNPRTEIDIQRLNELSTSIMEVGLLEPIIVRPLNGEYEVVVGERRYRASQQAGLEKVPAIIREYSDDEVVQVNLIENIHREELSAIEKGKVCKYLLEKCPEKYPSQAAIAEKIGVSKDAVSLWLRSVDIVPEEAQKFIAPATISGQVPKGKIDYSTAVRVGRAVEEPQKRVDVIQKLAEARLPVKQRTEIFKKMTHEPDKSVEQVFSEVSEAPIEMQFAAADKKPVIDGTKTQTARISVPDPRMKVGVIVHAAIFEPHVAELRITSIERKRLRYFNEEDAKREGGYSLDEFKEIWSKVHGQWDEDQLVYIIHFEKIK